MIAHDNVPVPSTTGQKIINNIRRFGHSGMQPQYPPMRKNPDLPAVLDLSDTDRKFAEILGMNAHAAHYLRMRVLELADNEVVRGRLRQLFTEIKLIDADAYATYMLGVSKAQQWYDSEREITKTQNMASLERWQQQMEMYQEQQEWREDDTRTVYLDFMRSLRGGVTLDSITPTQYALLMRLQELYPKFGFEKYRSWFVRYIRLTGTIPGFNRDVKFYAEARALLDD